MDVLFEGLVDRLRISGRLVDSMLLEIVHSAMLDAHNKTVSEEKRGLVRLHHNARFHEFSIMELECCLKVLQEEAKNNFSDGRYDFEQLISSLMEQQALMQKKLEELEIIIARKDRELTMREQNDVKLKQCFEMIGNDEVEQVAKEYVKNNCTNRSRQLKLETNDHGMITRLKSSIEEDLLKIEMKLENGRNLFTGSLQKLKNCSMDDIIDLEIDGTKQLHGLFNITQLLIGLEEMISGVSILKGNIKSCFHMLECSKVSFKTKLEENQLQMHMEWEILNGFMRCFIQEAQCSNCKLRLNTTTSADETMNLHSTEGTLIETAAFREEIEKVVVSSMINEWNDQKYLSDTNHSLRENINNVLFGEIIKALTKFSMTSSTAMYCKETDKVDVSSIINDCNDKRKVIEIEISLREDIHHVVISEIMKDLIKVCSSTSTVCHNYENSDEVQHQTVNKEVLREINVVFKKLSASFLDIEANISYTLKANNKRLEDLNKQLDVMKDQITFLKRNELLYQNAFLRRCYDLQTAEAEVDLLGDEIEFLLNLIKRSYEALYHKLAELQYNPEIVEIVNLLKRVGTELPQRSLHPEQ